MKQSFLSPSEFREAQDQLGLSDAQLARVLGYTDAVHVRRHKVSDTTRNSYRRVSAQTARLIQAYLDGYRPDDWGKKPDPV
ncbi:MAG: hypothetical protein AAF468_22645 [Pseudomonadota bacterium]